MSRTSHIPFLAGIASFVMLSIAAVALYHAQSIHDRAYVPRKTITVPFNPAWKVQRVISLAYSPDGSTLAETDLDTGLHCWDAHSLRPDFSNRSCVTGDGFMTVWTPDSRTVTRAASGYVQSLNTATGAESIIAASDMRPSRDGYFFIDAVSPQANLNAVGNVYGSIYVRDITTRKMLYHWQSPHGDLCALAFSRDNSRLAVATLLGPHRDLSKVLEIDLLDARTGRARQTIRWPNTQMVGGDPEGALTNSSVDFSPDGSKITASDDIGVVVWETATGSRLWQWKKQDVACGGGKHTRFSPDGHLLVATGWGDEVRVLNASTGKMLQIFHAQPTPIVLDISPDGKTLATGGSETDGNGTIKLWDISGL